MALATNTTCDVFHSGNSPPSSPNIAGVACLLTARYALGLERGEGDGVMKKYTHTLLVDSGVDVRDAWSADSVGTTADIVYVPDSTGTPFKVVYAERVGVGSAAAYKRVFLSRKRPTWPTKEL